MAVKRVSAVVRAPSMAASVSFWSTVLGAAPTFVDGERWAQFDVAGSRLSIGAGAEAPSSGVAVMVSVDDLDAFCAGARSDGLSVGEIVTGPHERRVSITGPGGEEVIAFQTLPHQ